MTTPIGEEFVRIRPDASTFRTELQAQISAAMTGVQSQVAAAQAQMRKTTTPIVLGGVSTLPNVKQATQQSAQAASQQAASLNKVSGAAKATNQQLLALSTTQRQTAAVTREMQHGITSAETAVGRYSRGMVAATAASTGFFRAVSFASGAFLIGAAAGAAIGAAVNEFSNMTTIAQQTVQLIKTTGGTANVTAGQVDALSKSILNLTGVDDELVKQGANVLLTFRLIRNEVGAGNDIFNRAVKAAADISSVFRTDLRGSALQLGKALQDPERGVTALRRSGITLSVSQRELIKELVRSGAVLTAQKVILGEVEHQVGGAAAAIGKTLPGQLRIMRENALNALGDLVKRLTESKTAADLAADGAQGLAATWTAVRKSVETVGPTLIGITQGLSRVTRAVGGAGAILAMAAAYGAVKIAVAGATRAMQIYTLASQTASQVAARNAAIAGTLTVTLQGEAAAEVAAARAAQRTMTAMVALNAAFAVGAAASGQWVVALAAGGLALVGMAAKARAAIVALRATGAAVTAFSVASAALGGPLGLAAIGAGALAVGLFKLAQAGRDATGSMNATKDVLDELNKSMDTNMRLRAAVGTARERVGVARFDVSAAQRDLQRAQQALAATQGAPGSVEFLTLQQQVVVVRQKLTKATDDLVKAEKELQTAQRANRENEAQQPSILDDITQKMQANLAATRQATVAAARFSSAGIPLNNPAKLAVQDLIDRFSKLRETYKAGSREASAAIAAIGTTLNRMPTDKEVKIIIRLASQGKNVNEILRALSITTGPEIPAGFLENQAVKNVTASLGQQAAILRGHLKTAKEKLAVARQELTQRKEAHRSAVLELEAAKNAVESAKESRQNAIEGLASAQQGLAEAHQNLADTISRANQSIAEAIRSAHEALNQSVQDAKSNLQDLGQAIAQAIGRFTEAGDQSTTKLSDRMKRLRAEILAGGGGPETIRAAQQVKFALTAQTPTVDTEKIQTQFSDLVDSFSRGLVTLPQFNRRFQALLKNVDVSGFRKKFGTAAANELVEQIRTFRRQAGLIARSPERAGGAIAQKLVNPLKALAQGTRDIAAARRQAARDIADAERNLADSANAVVKAEKAIKTADRQLAATERRLRQAQHKETIANTAAIKANAKETKQLRIVLQAKQALLEPKPKPKGQATQQANEDRAGAPH